jgi:type II secretory pathway pseudopilin PulG
VSKKFSQTNGITLIECIVVLIIVLLMIAVAGPYLLKNRELSRNRQCTQKMIELQKGLRSFLEASAQFPAGRSENHNYSALVGIVGFMEVIENFPKINTQIPTSDSPLLGIQIPGLACPADAHATRPSIGSSNYALSAGSGVDKGSLNSADGVFFANGGLPLELVEGELSSTVAFSERIVGKGDKPPASSRSSTEEKIHRWLIWELPDGMEASEQNCDGDLGAWNSQRGNAWIIADYRNTLYNHALLPNSITPECSNSNLLSGRFSASSFHVQGVNVGMCDGAVNFISQNVDLKIWQQISIRASARVAPTIEP